VTFNNVNLPAGTYRVTVHYVFALRANDDTSRYGRLRIDPDGVGNITDHWNTYPRTTTCCQTWTTGNVTVSAGTFDISFTHPGNISGPDRAPAIDRIVIARVS
jgi:hypothetical protein